MPDMTSLPQVVRRSKAARSLRAGVTTAALGVARLSPLSLRRHILFLLGHHKVGNFRHPSTLSEKINWRIIHDRRDVLRYTCDKLYAKQEAEKVGVAVAATLWCGESLEDLAGKSLPERWVLKPNDGSGLVAFGEGTSPDLRTLEALTHHWPRESSPAREGEWAYTVARRLFLVEEMLGTGRSTPTSYKFFVFHGEPLFVHAIAVAEAQFSEWRASSDEHWPPAQTAMRFYTSSWEPLDAQLADFPLASVEPVPPALPAMLDAARNLGRDFDFVRVDLMSDGETFYFGELTPYPHAGLTTFTPRKFDTELGSHWTLPKLESTREPVRRRP